jgi:signal-transduction protein with cAMP-binding, CBS, and nucleotidyltransferase domain
MALGASTMNISFFRIAPTDIKLVDETYAGGRGETRMFSGAEYHIEHEYTVASQLPTGDVGLVAGRLERVHAQGGEVIARQGAPADKFIIVVDGELEVSRESDGGTETVATLRPGEFFGDIAILRDSPRSATLRATTAVTLLKMDRDEFRTVVAQALGITADFDRIIRDRLGR